MSEERAKPLEEQTESELDRLAALQELDRCLTEKSDQVSSLQREVEEMDLELASQREAVAATSVERQTRESQRRELEARLEEEEEKMKNRRMRLNRVRNEKELNALRREIEIGKEANQQMENELLAEMQAVEALDTQLAEAQQQLVILEQKYASALVADRERIETLRRELVTDSVEREQVASSLSGELRAKYEQIFARRRGTTVVEIRNGTCMGCHMHVPPQFFNELLRTRDVRLCPNCHRILYWRPESDDGARGASR